MCHSADCPCRIVGNRPTNHLLEKGSRLFWAGRERNGGCHARSHRPNCADGSIGVEQLEPHVDIGSVDLSIEHRRFKRGTANMAAPFRGFLTSHNGASVNFLGDGTIFSGGTARPLRSVRTGAWDVRAPGMWQLDDCRTRREEILQSGMPKGRMGVRKQQALLQTTPIHGSQLQVENQERSNAACENQETRVIQKLAK